MDIFSVKFRLIKLTTVEPLEGRLKIFQKQIYVYILFEEIKLNERAVRQKYIQEAEKRKLENYQKRKYMHCCLQQIQIRRLHWIWEGNLQPRRLEKCGKPAIVLTKKKFTLFHVQIIML